MSHEAQIEFVRLTGCRYRLWSRYSMSHGKARHMPLPGEFHEAAARWVRSKDAQWDEHWYGPWAVVVNGIGCRLVQLPA